MLLLVICAFQMIAGESMKAPSAATPALKKDLPTFDFTELEKILLAEDSQAAIEEQLIIHGEDGQDRLFCDYVNCGCGIWLCPIWCWGRNTCVLYRIFAIELINSLRL